MSEHKNTLEAITIHDEQYFVIREVNKMPPFFMSIVSDSNHWLFISSNGGLSAGRKDAEHALFPYYTDDKITYASEWTGSKTIIKVLHDSTVKMWEPFSIRQAGVFNITRNLYKNALGNKVIFEEINNDLQIGWRYEWMSSDRYGFVRKSNLSNLGNDALHIEILDGLQNIIPSGVGADLQNGASNLVDAYKRSELLPQSQIGVFALSANIVDKAIPSEALSANIAWTTDRAVKHYLLSSKQLDAFRFGQLIQTEQDVKGARAAYFIHKEINLDATQVATWMIVANVNQTQSDVVQLEKELAQNQNMPDALLQDVQHGSERLLQLAASADGLSLSNDQLMDARHYSNTLFNIMRGGVIDHNYDIEKDDFVRYIKNANKTVAAAHQAVLQQLPELFSLFDLRKLIGSQEDPDLVRLCTEYLPIKFSRRHGDPSRPWNKFSINTKNEIDGSKILDYQGNWRDIFQNWEALAISFPEFLDAMVFKFLNASTFDGYNPYRVMKSGFDWETIEPDNPWSYIGYWGDHQLIYLLKLLEQMEAYFPNRLSDYLNKKLFVYAAVPYKIKNIHTIFENPKDTIDFDEEWDASLRRRRGRIGADGALLWDRSGGVHRVNCIEKILASLLAKVTNFVPEAGIWMNTQRPEWNDANNALVGNGASMVTLYYMRRYLKFFNKILKHDEHEELMVSAELSFYFTAVKNQVERFSGSILGGMTDEERKAFVFAMGTSASTYRELIYSNGFSGDESILKKENLIGFIEQLLPLVDQSILVNQRPDKLFHSYNLVHIKGDKMQVGHLDEMLEGQVAILSSTYLQSDKAVEVLAALRKSKLYREDQNSYILYPDKELDGFMQRNTIPDALVVQNPILQRLSEKKNAIIQKDANGKLHFGPKITNSFDLDDVIRSLEIDGFKIKPEDKQKIFEIYEEVFQHKKFTGRSGTFYAYEGLGSIYWHMVSKLLVATFECWRDAFDSHASQETKDQLRDYFYHIRDGIGVHKPTWVYGAFPVDPYSHTPSGRGAQQPGMTGQVKEDILARFYAFGVQVKDGLINFEFQYLQLHDLLTQSSQWNYIDIHQHPALLPLASGQLAFSLCQVPITYKNSGATAISIQLSDGTMLNLEGHQLPIEVCQKVYQRTGDVVKIEVHFDAKDRA